jgi:hypothetical protein
LETYINPLDDDRNTLEKVIRLRLIKFKSSISWFRKHLLLHDVPLSGVINRLLDPDADYKLYDSTINPLYTLRKYKFFNFIFELTDENLDMEYYKQEDVIHALKASFRYMYIMFKEGLMVSGYKPPEEFKLSPQ